MTFGDVQRRLLYIQKHKYLSYLGLPRGDAYNVRIRVLPHVAHLPKSFGSVLTSVILNSQLLYANTMNGDLLGGDKLVYEGCRDVSDMYNSCST